MLRHCSGQHALILVDGGRQRHAYSESFCSNKFSLMAAQFHGVNLTDMRLRYIRPPLFIGDIARLMTLVSLMIAVFLHSVVNDGNGCMVI